MSIRKIVTIIGARPQFIKASVVSRALRKNETFREIIIHTGQHYDANMSDIFFDQLQIPRPDHQMNVSGGGHGSMTGRMLIDIEEILLKEQPAMVLVYGDTNSTLAGALAASKLHIPVAHVEAGLRSSNIRMPEEINRILTDRLSTFLFCPSISSVANLEREGYNTLPGQVCHVGDVTQDSALMFAEVALDTPPVMHDGPFVLATMHRAENTDDPARLAGFVEALNRVHDQIAPVVMPLHPRTLGALKNAELTLNIDLIDPVGFIDMIALIRGSGLVLTDSGGLQKEAFFFGKPCLTMREETEWIELIEAGVNQLVGPDPNIIVDRANQVFGTAVKKDNTLYGGGTASRKIVEILEEAVQ